MAIVGIPGVRIVEAVHVDVELTLVDVHVGDESNCTAYLPNHCRSPCKSAVFYMGRRSPLIYCTNCSVFFVKE